MNLALLRPGAQDILNAIPVALILTGQDHSIAEVNAAAETVLNMSASSLVGKKLLAVMTPPPRFGDADGLAFAAYDIDLPTKRGGLVRADFHATPFAEHPGWQLIALANARDPQHGRRLDQPDRGRTAMAIAATLAHEIKNPLSGIRGAAQLLDGRVPEPDAAMTRLIRSEVDRVTALIDRMEGFTDDRRLELSAQNIHAIIDHCRAIAVQGFAAAIPIQEEYDPSLPAVLAHRDSLVQVIINLMKNACEALAGHAEPMIQLTTRYRHGVSLSQGEGRERRALPIEFCIIDNGPGVPDALADQIFEPFVSGRKSGTGLGLALTDKLVRDMGGIIQYAREGDPPRTIFRLLLQRAEDNA
jgi:two-component system, NtrC family, nitrogen regulation sensor histidine kinase GlnL